jgi:DNA modification methylase
MDGKKADMVFTDPPYNTGMQQGRHSKEWGIIENDDMTEASFSDFLNVVVSNLYSCSKTDAHKYICMSWSAYDLLYQAMPEVKNCIVWVKNNFGLGHGYRPQHEFILFDGGNIEAKDQSNVWLESKDASTEYKHPTQKPIGLSSKAIKNSSKINETILDLFGGSGSTLIACEQTKRTCYMMEIDPKYCTVIIDRFEKLTNQKATLCAE